MESRKIILFELNEVPYRIIDRYCEAHPNSCIAQTLACSRQYETYAEDSGFLAPTKTWPTVHRGVDYDKHGLANFGQPVREVDKEFPPLWKIASSHGIKVGVFGSLFTYPMPENLQRYSFYMPDAFATDSLAHPQYLSSFQDFNLSQSRASMRNVSQRIDLKAALSLTPNLPNLGLTLKTFFEAGQQVISEKFDPKVRTRRRTLQAILGFDIFMKQLQVFKPDLATFFTNHVAATMHRYWAAAFPEDYKNFQLKSEWVVSFRDEIDFAMQKSDELLTRLVSFVDKNQDYVLYVITSMGQAAHKAEHTASWLTIKDFSKFMLGLGLEASDYQQLPAMAPIFNAVIAESKLEEFRLRSSKLTINGKNIIKELEHGFFEIKFEYFQNYQGPSYVELEGHAIRFEEMGLANTPHEDGVYLTADHIPQGVMFVYDPRYKVRNHERTKISTLDIAPTIINNFAIPIPFYMNRPLNLLNA